MSTFLHVLEARDVSGGWDKLKQNKMDKYKQVPHVNSPINL